MKHILASFKTSLLGLILIGAGIYTVIEGKSSWLESGVIIGTGLGLLGAKDADQGGGVPPIAKG